MRTRKTLLIGFLATMLAAGSAWADGSNSSNKRPTTSAGQKADAKDPVALAFRLPGGTTLNAKQENAYEKLKTKYESSLREALDLIHSKDKTDQSKGLKLNRDTRAQIKAGIKSILAMPYEEAQRAAEYQNAQNAAAYQNACPRPAGGACPCGRR